MSIETFELAVIGYPISHSLSPVMHDFWLKQVGIEGRYRAIEIAPDNLPDIQQIMNGEGVTGFNVTVPHKEAIIPHLDRLAPQARRIGAVNTVRMDDKGALVGFNTDGMGFIEPMKTAGYNFSRPVLLIGAGGAARACLAALLGTNTPLIMVANRNQTRAEALANDLGSGRTTIIQQSDLKDAVAAAGLIINATSLGMAGQPALELDLSSAANDCWVYDLVYAPLETALLKDARSRGLRTCDGLDMLIHQGAAAFRLWTGQEADTVSVRQHLLAHLDQK